MNDLLTIEIQRRLGHFTKITDFSQRKSKETKNLYNILYKENMFGILYIYGIIVLLISYNVS